MAKRYYLSAIVGTGTDGDALRSAVSDYGVSSSVEYPPQDPNTGKYTRNECLVIVEAPSHVDMLKDVRMFGMPDFPLDGKLSAMRSQTLTAFNTAAASRGYSITWGSADAYRDVVRSLGKQLNPNFSEDNFDVV